MSPLESALQARIQKGEVVPQEIGEGLTLEEAYPLQHSLRKFALGLGEKQVGWKIGVTSSAGREGFGIKEPVYGYLLQSGQQNTEKAKIPFESLKTALIESELCFTIGKTLEGTGVDEAQVLNALSSVHPSHEILERRLDMPKNFPMAVADNILQVGYIKAQGQTPSHGPEELDEVVADILIDGQKTHSLTLGKVMDNPIRSIVWLVHALAKSGLALEKGMDVMSGSFHPPLPAEKGQTWETHFSGLGKVVTSFP